RSSQTTSTSISSKHSFQTSAFSIGHSSGRISMSSRVLGSRRGAAQYTFARCWERRSSTKSPSITRGRFSARSAGVPPTCPCSPEGACGLRRRGMLVRRCRVGGRNKFVLSNRESRLLQEGTSDLDCMSEIAGHPETQRGKRELDQKRGDGCLRDVGGAARSQHVEPGIAHQKR